MTVHPWWFSKNLKHQECLGRVHCHQELLLKKVQGKQVLSHILVKLVILYSFMVKSITWVYRTGAKSHAIPTSYILSKVQAKASSGVKAIGYSLRRLRMVRLDHSQNWILEYKALLQWGRKLHQKELRKSLLRNLLQRTRQPKKVKVRNEQKF